MAVIRRWRLARRRHSEPLALLARLRRGLQPACRRRGGAREGRQVLRAEPPSASCLQRAAGRREAMTACTRRSGRDAQAGRRAGGWARKGGRAGGRRFEVLPDGPYGRANGGAKPFESLRSSGTERCGTARAVAASALREPPSTGPTAARTDEGRRAGRATLRRFDGLPPPAGLRQREREGRSATLVR